MHVETTDVVAVAVALSTIYLLKRLRQRLPPGPGSSGGLFGIPKQLPAGEPWKAFLAWSKKFGPVISFYLGWTPVVVINTARDASELLDRRGEIYSSRPRSVIGQQILTGNMRGLTMEYGDRWKRWRKLQHTGMGGKSAQAYRHFQSLEDEDVVIENSNAMKAFNTTQIPGKYLADSWPILLWLPKSLQWFRWDLDKRRELDIKLYVGCLRNVERKMVEGTAKECMSTRILNLAAAGGTEGASEVEMAYAVCSPFSAGIGTVAASLEVFLLAMVHNPACASKAQAELDSVVGRARMPDFSDEPILPYVHALVKEVMRWRPIAPTGIPHAVTQDDYYNGLFIPKDATVFANICAICQDPDLFPDAEAFRPDRFLDTQDSRLIDFNIPFGFGRRICPGQDVAVQSLFIIIARMLWAFDISVGTDEGGSPVLPDTSAFVPGLVRKPLPFRVNVAPRTEDVAKLIAIAASDAEIELEAWN
ncbi:hypothetical protein EW145_g4057 [Phellinidium pouzarii]|uniref:Cytochrome P450 n=1 Tax=Phellinidium pouzarii TaxID=167371 RepID=A0A4S4L4V1_9AGAM|nr:hypothetical protein EW145_g4057 [Phellinidium pouzarii]